MKSIKRKTIPLMMALAFLILASCSSRTGTGNSLSASSQSEPPPPSGSEFAPAVSPADESQITAQESLDTEEPEQPAVDTKQANEIMCAFGAERKIQYGDNGQPLPSDTEEYQTSAISFYYDEDGISGAQDITPYGFYGWYLAYTKSQADKIAGIIPGFERFVLVRNDPVSGEIYGAPGDAYEKIVTSFFDVDVRQLRGEDLYDEAAHAYVPIVGPGRGEQPSVRVVAIEQERELISLDIDLEEQFAKSYSLRLTVRKDERNEFAGIKFVSLIKK